LRTIGWVSERPDFGDRVRIRAVPETEERGFAGREGDVYGESVPSVSGVAAIGDRGEDHAFSVYFRETGEQEWFAPHVVEFVSRGEPGVEVSFDDGPTFVRDEDGSWRELGGPTPLGDVLTPSPVPGIDPNAERIIMRWLRRRRRGSSSG
jgi:hypothetical protein